MTTPPFPHPSGARPPAVPADLVPRHVAIVMDGNGRWANARGLPRTKGHEAGEAALLDVVAGCIEIGVAPRVGLRVLDRELEALARRGALPHGLQPRRHPPPARRSSTSWGVRVRWAGRRPRLWRSVIKELEVAEEMTRTTTCSR